MEKAKIVQTNDIGGNPNGFLMELQKKGKYTSCYLTSVDPGAFKGYHLHRIRESNYVCIKGKVKVILYTKNGREEYIMSQGDKLNIPINTPTGLTNEWKEEGWLINFPNPYYDPDLKDEQEEFAEWECEKGLYNGSSASTW